MGESAPDLAGEGDEQRVRDFWSGRVCGLKAAEKRVKEIIRCYERALELEGRSEDDPLYIAGYGAVATLKLLRRDLRKMQQPPKD